MPRDTFKAWGEKPDSLKSRMYKDILASLAVRPMTIHELAEALPYSAARITQACQVMLVVGDAHVGDHTVGVAGVKVRRFYPGPGKSEASCQDFRRLDRANDSTGRNGQSILHPRGGAI
jgi:hypothetical protein